MYLIRLDDAAENMNIENWQKIENLLDKYNIKPLVGVIPHNEDSELMKFKKNNNFWKTVKKWETKGWTICMHGYNHVYIGKSGGINPINNRTEFANIDYNTQAEKISKGIKILNENGISTEVFFAPSHTFDLNTLKALKMKSNINVISDTIANDIYYENDFYFIPQQSGKVRNFPFKITTFCYHPNEMKEKDFEDLDSFINKNINKMGKYTDIKLKKRKRNLYDRLMKMAYFNIRKIRYYSKQGNLTWKK